MRLLTPLRSGRLGSLGLQFGVLVLSLTVPLIVLWVWQYRHTAESVRALVAETQQSYLRLYQESIDRTLDSAALVVETLAAERADNPAVLFREVHHQSELTGLWVADTSTGTFLTGYSPYVDDEERQAIRNLVTGTSPGPRDRWVAAAVGEGHFLVYRTQTGSRTYGAWVDVDQFLQPLYLIDSGQDSVSFFLVGEQEVFPPSDFLARRELPVTRAASGSVVGSREHYLFVASPSRSGDFSLGMVLPEARYLKALPSFFEGNVLVILLTLSVLLAFLIQFRRMVLRPLRILTSAMHQVGADLEAQIEFPALSHEVALIRDTFNAMVERIRTLKIDVYEEKLHTQQEELNFLQLQLNPHFFLNSLNILYQLAEGPNVPLLQELIVRLSKYFRFMHNGGTPFVLLGQELEHAENYFEIQAVRFPDRVSYLKEQVDVPSDTPVPPLLIHTFVENSVKYGLRTDRRLSLTVTIRRSTPTRILIRIEDNGPGFPDAILVQLRSQTRILGPDREHVGITNVRRRLALLYGEKASIACYNAWGTGGAVVEITVPVPRESEGTRSTESGSIPR